MSKVVDLAGLSKAVTKIKDWTKTHVEDSLKNIGVEGNYGGIVCLYLGATRPDDEYFYKVAALIRSVVNREKLYTLSLFDTDTNRWYNDIQIFLSDDAGTPAIRCTRYTENGTVRVFTYYFNDATGGYNKKVLTFSGLQKTNE